MRAQITYILDKTDAVDPGLVAKIEAFLRSDIDYEAETEARSFSRLQSGCFTDGDVRTFAAYADRLMARRQAKIEAIVRERETVGVAARAPYDWLIAGLDRDLHTVAAWRHEFLESFEAEARPARAALETAK